ncbi:MAG TPA: hypothetical protein VF317_11870 [Dermatophilaceae bacterium]
MARAGRAPCAPPRLLVIGAAERRRSDPEAALLDPDTLVTRNNLAFWLGEAGQG